MKPLLVTSLFCTYFFGIFSPATAQTCPVLTNAQETALISEHLGTLRPSGDAIIAHRGHVYAYDFANNMPKWTAWHVTQAYTDTPKREKHWYRMAQDKALPKANQVSSGDYTGSGYHRGHLAPYFTSGGDRDGDGQDAEFENKEDFPIEDIDDACTVFEINYMSNMTPQLPNLNSQNGSWYQLETLNRNAAKSGAEFHMIAGPIFTSASPKVICRSKNADGSCEGRAITIPDAFFKIVNDGVSRTGYIFFQDTKVSTNGCMPSQTPVDCVAPISEIEALTGLTLK